MISELTVLPPHAFPILKGEKGRSIFVRTNAQVLVQIPELNIIFHFARVVEELVVEIVHDELAACAQQRALAVLFHTDVEYAVVGHETCGAVLCGWGEGQ